MSMISRFLEIYLRSTGSLNKAAVTSPGHQRTGSPGRDCFLPAQVLEVKGRSRRWTLHLWPSGLIYCPTWAHQSLISRWALFPPLKDEAYLNTNLK